jgi:glyoxylase-like metal-dependent hydrolase (beta-lactamase superfamily II)
LPAQADSIFLSHFHPDHIGGLREAPGAGILHSAAGLEALTRRSPLHQARSAFFPELLPEDFARRAVPLEDFREIAVPPFRGLDIAGDGELIAIPLPGHAVGQYGLLCRLEQGRRVFLAANAAWVRNNITRLDLPAPPARLLMENFQEYVATLRLLQDFQSRNPDVAIVPSHCPESIAAFQSDAQ